MAPKVLYFGSRKLSQLDFFLLKKELNILGPNRFSFEVEFITFEVNDTQF